MEVFKPRHEAAQLYISDNNPDQMVEVGPKIELQWLRDDVDKDKWDRDCDETYKTWRENIEKLHYEVRFQDPTLQIMMIKTTLLMLMSSKFIRRRPDMDGVCVHLYRFADDQTWSVCVCAPVSICRRPDMYGVCAPVLICSLRRR
jgi:hypothetical protein